MSDHPRPTPHYHNDIDRIAQEQRIVVCVGSGGVGKTTTSAVIALHAAMMGRKVLVLTIDPAKRLANSLGVDALDDTAREIPLERFREVGLEPKPGGQLYAMMLDMKQAFDRLIKHHAPDVKTRESILNNRFYGYFSTSLAGTQEYSAMERLYELSVADEYDLIVLDTPPTTHALDFLDAPKRLFDALDSSAMQWIAKSSRVGFSLFRLGTSSVLRMLSRFTGGTFLQELGEFVGSFNSMWDGFKERAAETKRILSSADVAFYVVTSPDSITLDEALFFFRRLEEEGIPIGGIIVNRVHQGFVPKPVLSADPEEIERRLRAVVVDDALPEDLREKARSLDLKELSHHLQDNAREFHVLAHQDEKTIADLKWKLEHRHPLHTIPFFSTDIYSFKGLERIRSELFALVEERAPEDWTPGRL